MTTEPGPQDGLPPRRRVQDRPQELVDDPAPYVWMDLPFRPTPGQTVGFGVFFVACAAAYAVILVATWPGYVPWAVVFVVALFAAAGAFLIGAGRARSAWRQRHPGVDPLYATAPRSGATVRPLTPAGTVVRILVVVVAWAAALLGLVLAVSVLRAPTSADVTTSGRVGAFVVLIGVTGVSALVGWVVLRRMHAMRRAAAGPTT